MKERPILFSGDMVNAILAGTKSQTRRVLVPQPANGVRRSPFVASGLEDLHGREIRLRYWPDMTLWVRETWAAIWPEDCDDGRVYGEPGVPYDAGRHIRLDECKIEYRADVGPDMQPGGWVKGEEDALPWHPSIFMPRALSRITLEVTDVRVQQLRDITETDALAEGIDIEYGYDATPADKAESARFWFAHMWDDLNAKRGYSWESNPWVWAITFKVVTP